MEYGSLQFPNLPRTQNTGERRILAQPPGFLRIRAQEITYLLQRAFEYLPPFRVAVKQRRRIRIQASPAIQVFVRNTHLVWLLPQPFSSSAPQFEADLVYPRVTHMGNVIGQPERVNARWRSGTSVAGLNTLLNEFNQMQQMMKMGGGGMPGLPGMPRG